MGRRSAVPIAVVVRRAAARAPGELPRRRQGVRPDRPHPAARTRSGTACCSRSASAVGHVGRRAAGSRSSCRSTTSPVGAGSTGRSCSRWRCRGTCSCSWCSASTASPARSRSSLFGAGCGSRASAARWGDPASSPPSSTPTCTCSVAARSSASPARRSKPRVRSAHYGSRLCAGSRSRSPARRSPRGVALAIMEALADFGTVDLLGVQALTSAIYRVWNGAFDEAAALQLATVLLDLTLVMVTIERLLRGRARYNQALGRGDAVIPVRLRGWRGWLARCPGLRAPDRRVRAPRRPARRVVGRDDRRRHHRSPPGDAADHRGSCWRWSPPSSRPWSPWSSCTASGCSRRASDGCQRGCPHSATRCRAPSSPSRVYVPLVWIDRRFVDAAESVFNSTIGLHLHRLDPRTRVRVPRSVQRAARSSRSSRA